MVEGHARVVPIFPDHWRVPLHHPCGMVPLPVRGGMLTVDAKHIFDCPVG
jgi:hypothetical protein